MQTYSHLLITAVLGDQIWQKKAVKPGKAFLLGAMLPDVPLFILSIGYFVSRRLNLDPANQSMAAFDTLYFTNPWWIAEHNLFHAPLLLLLYAGIGFGLMRQTARPTWQKWGRALLWLAAGCGLHSLCDIFTHVTDGPVIFFPFNWSYRYRAPISYWDPAYNGRLFRVVEHLLDLLLVGGLVFQRKTAKRQSNQRP